MTSADVRDNGLRSVDIKNGSVQGADIATGSVGSSDVADGTLTGADIEDGSIDKADLAANATWTALSFDGHILAPTGDGRNLIETSAGCVGYSSRNTSIYGSLTVPVGATITGFTATWVDESAAADVQIRLWNRLGSSFGSVTTVSSTGSPGVGTTTSGPVAETVDPGEQFLVEFIFPTASEPASEGGFCGIELHLS